MSGPNDAHAPHRELLLGFTLCDAICRESSEWTDERRRKYLLRDVRRPLSFDDLVWRSVDADDPRRKVRMPIHDSKNMLETGLWPTPQGPRELLARGFPAGQDMDLVAFSRLVPIGRPFRLLNEWTELPEQPISDLGAGWRLAGYDVVDGTMPSGLSNCSYGPAERDALAAEWADKLNEHHLFNAAADALRFAALADARAPEHAPFFVFGIYLFSEAAPQR